MVNLKGLADLLHSFARMVRRVGSTSDDLSPLAYFPAVKEDESAE